MPAHARRSVRDVPDTIHNPSTTVSPSTTRTTRLRRFGAGAAVLVASLGVIISAVAPASAAPIARNAVIVKHTVVAKKAVTTKKTVVAKKTVASTKAAAHRPSAALVKAVLHRQAVAAAAHRKQAVKAAAVARHKAAVAATARHAFVVKLIGEAASHLGEPYSYGSAGPTAFDCSGFTRFVFRRFGISLPHSSYAQYAMSQHIPASEVEPGDLLFLSGLGHVAIYVGNGMMIDATRPGSTVQLRHPYGAFLVGRVLH